MVSWLGYGTAVFAPGVYKPATGPYVVNHNLIRAHAKAYRTYRKDFYARQKGNFDHRRKLNSLNERVCVYIFLIKL